LINGKIGKIKSLADLWYLARAILKPTSRILYKNSFEMKKTLSMLSGMTAAQGAFVYILCNKEISSCVFGTTSLTNLNEILETADLELDAKNKLEILNSFESLKEKISL